MYINKISGTTNFGKINEAYKPTNKYDDKTISEIKKDLYIFRSELDRILRNMSDEEKHDYIKGKNRNSDNSIIIRDYVEDIAELTRALQRKGVNPFEK